MWFLSSLAPRLLKVDLKAESRKLEAELAGGAEVRPTTQSAYREWDLRAYRIDDAAWADKSVADLEKSFAPERVFVERIRRGAEILDASPDMVLGRGDAVAIAARRRVLAGGIPVGVEIEDRTLLDFPMVALDVVVTNRSLVDRTIAELAEMHGRGVALLQLVRGGEDIPWVPSTTVNRGDILRLSGATRDVERAGAALGYIERPSHETDVVFVGLGIVIGGPGRCFCRSRWAVCRSL